MNKAENSTKIALATMIMSLLALLALPLTVQAGADKTLANLQEAFNGESNAQAKYTAYAQKAEQEGYAKVARLFRAAAQAEGIHAQNHAVVIISMGAEPMAEIKLPEIKSTSMNLEDAIKGETYEQKVMYPGFLKVAAAENAPEAIQTFTYAQDVEGEHAKLYNMALNNLASWKVADRQFAVCPICGFTIEGKPSFANCPVCGTQKDDFLSVS